MAKQRYNLTGKTYHRLTAVSPAGKDWLWRCECGTEKIIPAANVKNGNTKSCGCFNTERLKERFTKHGMIDTPEYSTWGSMKDRCKRHSRYKNRGITVCDRWLESFENFYADMGDRPEGTSIDRIDNDKGYEPGNCRWATSKEQSRNKGWNIWVEYQGREWNLKDLGEWSGVGYQTLYQRHKAGVTGDDLFRRRKSSES